jgi:hypothetical protein
MLRFKKQEQIIATANIRWRKAKFCNVQSGIATGCR